MTSKKPSIRIEGRVNTRKISYSLTPTELSLLNAEAARTGISRSATLGLLITNALGGDHE